MVKAIRQGFCVIVFNINRLKKTLGFNIKKFYNINYIKNIKKSKTICSDINKCI